MLMALVLCYKDMLEKVTMRRTRQFSAFSRSVTERPQLNATHAQLLKKLETDSSRSNFKKFDKKNRSETT